jgi:hypothetical protein
MCSYVFLLSSVRSAPIDFDQAESRASSLLGFFLLVTAFHNVFYLDKLQRSKCQQSYYF